MKKQKEYPVSKAMYNPAHPGEFFKEMYIKPLKISITKASEMLDIDRTTMSRFINGHISVSIDMAMRLGKALNTSAELWLGMQQKYDLSPARKRNIDLSRVQKFKQIENHASF